MWMKVMKSLGKVMETDGYLRAGTLDFMNQWHKQIDCMNNVKYKQFTLNSFTISKEIFISVYFYWIKNHIEKKNNYPGTVIVIGV